jgi:hypothetical protein
MLQGKLQHSFSELFYSDVEGSGFLRNAIMYLPQNTTSHPRKQLLQKNNVLIEEDK